MLSYCGVRNLNRTHPVYPSDVRIFAQSSSISMSSTISPWLSALFVGASPAMYSRILRRGALTLYFFSVGTTAFGFSGFGKVIVVFSSFWGLRKSDFFAQPLRVAVWIFIQSPFSHSTTTFVPCMRYPVTFASLLAVVLTSTRPVPV